MKKLTTLLKKKDRGFTLIEIIVVIAILAVLAALAIPAIAGYIQNSKAQTNLANAKMIYNAASAYLASDPTATAVSMDDLTTGNFLANEPLTAEGNSYGVSYDGTDVTVTWTGETDVTDEAAGTYPPAE